MWNRRSLSIVGLLVFSLFNLSINAEPENLADRAGKFEARIYRPAQTIPAGKLKPSTDAGSRPFDLSKETSEKVDLEGRVEGASFSKIVVTATDIEIYDLMAYRDFKNVKYYHPTFNAHGVNFENLGFRAQLKTNPLRIPLEPVAQALYRQAGGKAEVAFTDAQIREAVNAFLAKSLVKDTYDDNAKKATFSNDFLGQNLDFIKNESYSRNIRYVLSPQGMDRYLELEKHNVQNLARKLLLEKEAKPDEREGSVLTGDLIMGAIVSMLQQSLPALPFHTPNPVLVGVQSKTIFWQNDKTNQREGIPSIRVVPTPATDEQTPSGEVEAVLVTPEIAADKTTKRVTVALDQNRLQEFTARYMHQVVASAEVRQKLPSKLLSDGVSPRLKFNLTNPERAELSSFLTLYSKDLIEGQDYADSYFATDRDIPEYRVFRLGSNPTDPARLDMKVTFQAVTGEHPPKPVSAVLTWQVGPKGEINLLGIRPSRDMTPSEKYRPETAVPAKLVDSLTRTLLVSAFSNYSVEEINKMAQPESAGFYIASFRALGNRGEYREQHDQRRAEVLVVDYAFKQNAAAPKPATNTPSKKKDDTDL